ncbi:hypothetical protein CJ260_07940 [Megasphaera sp. ASD88]|nr:hypothetical protein CJ260_07940 [Megasphaera sp. ASD88]
MKGKQLRKAVLLGMAMSMAVWTTGMAQEIGVITEAGQVHSPYDTSVEMTNDDPRQAAIQVTDQQFSIETTNGVHDITIESAGSGIRTENGESDIELKSSGDNIIHFDNSAESDGDGITVEDNSKVTLHAENGMNEISSQIKQDGVGDGVRIEGNGQVEVNGRYNTISVGDDGLYIHEISNANSKIEITATSADANGVGNTINGKNGIHTDGAGTVNVISTDGGNVIHGTQNAVYASGSGTITISATANNTGEGISWLADYEDYNNILTSGGNGVYSDNTGTTNVIADHDNIIAGTTNGIWSDKAAGTINVTAGNNNIIGLYEDESKTITSKDGLNVGAGSVNLTAGYNNSIYGTHYGVSVSNGGSTSISSKLGNNTISAGEKGIYTSGTTTISTVEGNNVITGNTSSGIHVNENGRIELETDKGSNSISGGTEGVLFNSAGNKISAYGNNKISGGDFEKQIGSGINSAPITETSSLEIVSLAGNNIVKGGMSGILFNPNSQLIMNAAQGINSVSGDINGIWETTNSSVTLTAMRNEVFANNGVWAEQNSSLELNANGEDNYIKTDSYGVIAQTTSIVNLNAIEGQNRIESSGYGIYSTDDGSKVKLEAGENTVLADTCGIQATTSSDIDIIAGKSNNNVDSKQNGILAQSNGTVSLLAQSGSNKVNADNGYAVFASGETLIDLDAKLNNVVSGNTYGIVANQGAVTLDADASNSVESVNQGVYAYSGADVNMTAGMDNIIHAGNTKTVEGFGTNYGINARSGSAVTLDAGNQNAVLGAVFASRSADDAMTNVTLDGASNVVQSAAAIANAGGLNDGKEVISSLYAEHGAQLSLSGDQNVIRTYADNTNENQLERTVWAYETADITIDGQTYISTDRYETSPNSLDIAVAAGTATDLKEDKVNAPVADRATVNINYDSYTDGDGNTIQSSIEGDILSAYAGEVNITPKSDTAKIDIKGNILAGNNGVLNVNLGNGGTLTGRADDYGDAGVVDNSGHGTSFFNPAFSSKILKGGEVNLTMGEGSKWKVTGQSWITTVDTTGSSNAIIDLVSSNTDKNSSAHALTIYDMKGDAEFKMSLDADRSISDMVYMKHADGSYVVNVIDPVTQQDMYADRSEGGIFDGLRFATVGKGSKATFRAVTLDGGINNIEYEVGTDSYDTSNENHHYDSSTGDGVGNTEKPGTDLVEGFFGSDGTPGAPEAPANGIMMMAARADESLGTNTDANGTEVDETTNFKLIGIKSSEISDAGKTVVAMSRVNYSNAVYMDRLNKRMGEARYIDGDEGLWVRMRHDRIGKSDAFRSMNTMMELGYDTRVNDREDGEHRQGVAIDYMRGTADYKNVAGEGDVRRGGIWFYDTWLGNKGHYTDYVLKFGRLSNDFELYTRTLGEKVTGDYSNFVYSASAEYGRKKDLGNNWYIEPQAQIQYAHVTDADYTTSQDTHVQLDAIDSLIGRVGFRLGKDVGEKSTFYIKADVLHEFLGDQDIEARDATGLLSTTYENEGTWYDIGLGFSHQFSKGTYMYLDMEKSIGNDNEDTYQFNFGMNWKV